jgi:6-phosphogluconate dehydrogenase (decarboxylating)
MRICIGMIGLGRMGGNMARRLCRGEIQVLAFDREIEAARRLSAHSGVRVRWSGLIGQATGEHKRKIYRIDHYVLDEAADPAGTRAGRHP